MNRILGIMLAIAFSWSCGLIGFFGLSLTGQSLMTSFEFLSASTVRSFSIGFSIFFTLLLLYYSLKKSFIPQVHKGLPLIAGIRLRGIELPEGFNGWLPKPFGDINIHDMKEQEPINLSFIDGKAITLSDGTKLASVEISVIWKKMDGRLYDCEKIGGSIPAYITELAEDRVRNAAIALTGSFDYEKKKDYYMNLDALVLEQSLSRWQDFIKEGALKYLTDNQKRMLENTGKHILVKDAGLVDVLKKVGIEIVHLTISSAKLPDNIREAIDATKLEPIERDREAMNMGSVLAQANTINDLVADPELAVMVAMAEKGTEGVKINAIRGSKNTTTSDKIATGLLQQDGQNGDNT